MARPGLNIELMNGGLGRRTPNADMITGVVMNAIAIDDLELGKIYTLNSLQDAELLGLNKQYDTDNKVLTYHHLQRLFLRNPSIVVYFMPVDQSVTLTDMVDKTKNYAAKLLREKAGEIVQLMIALNPLEAYEPTIESGFDADSVSAFLKAQELADAEFAKDRYCDFIVEMRSFSGTATAALNLRQLETNCKDVSGVAMADQNVSNRPGIISGYAAVGDFVGMLSKAAVSQNPGELIDAFNLTDTNAGAFVEAGLSSGLSISEYSDDDLDLLAEKGIIFATSTPGIAGYHIVDTPTGAGLDSDYAFIENNRTIKKAIKQARQVLLPRVKARIYVDPNTGQMAPEDCKDIESEAEAALNGMLSDGDISGGVDAYVDPSQNVLATSKLEVLLTFIPVAIGRKITLKIGFNNPLNSN